MAARNYILATAGHVDHGKSSLVKALTGTDPDRLPEEKARGITIDLGFAHLDLEGTIAGEPASFHVGIVDVPGHEDFVKNMVAGVGSIDLALLIVAADDGWMPQTEEHLQILSYLGVSRAVVSLTKIDLAADEQAVRAEIRAQLADSPLAGAPIVGTSVISGSGIGELKAALAAVLAETPLPRNIGKPRLPVDRVFVLRGIGTVVTGTLTGGALRKGEAVAIEPRGLAGRIRSVQNHSQEVEESGPGTRTALNIVDAKGPAGEKGPQRGDVITLPSLGESSKFADVVLEKSGRLHDLKASASRPLKDGTRVRVHLGSGDVPARIALLGKGLLEPGGRRIGRVRFEAPVFAFAGDRFIVRDWSEQATLAGGIVLDPDPPRQKLEARAPLLEERSNAPDDPAVFVATEARGLGAVRGFGLLRKSRFSEGEIAAALDQLIAQNVLHREGEWAVDAACWKQLCVRASKLIEERHANHPDREGAEMQELKTALSGHLPAPELWDALLRDLEKAGFKRTGQVIGKATHRLSMPPHLQAACATVRRALSGKPFDPPSRKEVAPDAQTQQALRFLVQTGEVLALSEDVMLLNAAYESAVAEVRKFLSARGSATASEIRQMLATSRRVLIPLLEMMDKNQVTRREGDKRVLRPGV